MKIELLFGALLTSLCGILLPSCSNADEVIENNQVQTESELVKGVTVILPESPFSEETRSAHSIVGGAMHTDWEDGDTLGIYPIGGDQVAFPISDGVGTSKAKFDGGAWALRSSYQYAAYYPFAHKNYDVNDAVLTFDYTGQVQEGDGSLDHLSDYDFLAAGATETSDDGSVSLTLNHLGCFVRMQLTIPEANKLTSVRIASNNTPFIIKGTVDLSVDTPALASAQTSSYVELDLKNITVEADETVTLYMMMAPVDMSNSILTITVFGNGGVSYSQTLIAGKNMIEGKAYNYAVSLNKDASQYVAVDLGLPSGLKWASFNVGATAPEEFGYYFAWGETEPKSSFEWSNYNYCNGSSNLLTKYCVSDSYGSVDNKSILYLDDDAAHVMWGGNWRMPTLVEFDELREECTWTLATYNSVTGYKVASNKNDNYIFIPIAGAFTESSHSMENEGLYWSSVINTEVPYQACALHVSSTFVAWNNVSSRYFGYPVRPVFKDFETYFLNVDKSMVSLDSSSTRANIQLSTNDSWTVSSDVNWITLSAASGRGDNLLFITVSENTSSSSRTGIVTIVGSNNTTKTVTVSQEAKQIDNNSWDETDVDHEYVDLDLPSGLLWATCNVGAKTPEGYGGYFAWGETAPKSIYSWATYKYCLGSEGVMTKYCLDSSLGEVDNKAILDPSDDAAHVLWGGDWRMPTNEEMEELVAECTWVWKTQSEINGYLVSSKRNGNSIFLPAADCLAESLINCAGSNGMYWTSSLETSYSVSAYHFCFYSDNRYYPESGPRYVGCTIRPVCTPK